MSTAEEPKPFSAHLWLAFDELLEGSTKCQGTTQMAIENM